MGEPTSLRPVRALWANGVEMTNESSDSFRLAFISESREAWSADDLTLRRRLWLSRTWHSS